MKTEKRRGWSPPKSFDEYRLLRPLGRGGMGDVYLAHDTLLERPVAVKFIGALEPDAGAREQFLTEARAAARLQHPNVLTIYRVGELDRRPFIISEFIRGDGLDKVDKPMPWTRVLELGVGLARGLAAAHRRGVLHRDIKPGNTIITEDGSVKLLDFGLAKIVDVSTFHDESEWHADPVSADALTQDLPGEEPAPEEPDDGPREPASTPSSVSSSLSDTPVDLPRFNAGAAQSPSTRPLDVAPGGPADIATEPNLDDLASRSRGEAPPAPTTLSTVRGTPYYMAPELWRGEPATRRSDVYSLGALLYELCAGDPPHQSTPRAELPQVVARQDAKPLIEAAPSVDPRFAAIIDRCLRRDPLERYGSGDEVREDLEQLVTRARRDSIPEGNPYRGLLPFEAEHRALFFGRQNEIGTLLERLRSESFLVVAGDSGVGKSSLCRAGLLPLVTEGALGGGRSFTAVAMVPGRNPLIALASALAAVLSIGEEELAARIRTDPLNLSRSAAKHLGDTRGLIVFIDQLEELVTISDADEAASVAEALGYLATRIPGVRLLMTVRSDFLARVASLPGLGDEISRALYFLRPLSPDKIREAVVGPARAKGVSFESDALVDTLVESTARAEGSLPLLQFALGELWEARRQGSTVITTDALSALGGVAGALARHADHVLLGLPPDQHAAARRILMALVTLDGTRARRSEDELVHGDPSAHAALEALVRGRLLVVRDQGEGAAYEVAHEALLRGWDTLRRWLDEQADSRAVKHRLETSAAEWERLGRAREALWSARRLAESAVVDPGSLTPLEAAFIAASRRSVRQKRLTGALIIGLLLTIVLVYGASVIKRHVDLKRELDVQIQNARNTLNEIKARDVAAEDLRQQAFEAFDTHRREDGERLWESARERTSEVDRAYASTSQALETVLTQDVDRTDAREMLSDTLYARALIAERDYRPAQRDDLLRRMEVYRTVGKPSRNTRAHLTIASNPPGAQVTLEEYKRNDKTGKRYLADLRTLGQTPIEALDLSAGSYLLTLTASGREAVRYPVLLGLGADAHISVDLPDTSTIPEGFVYIPRGDFLFGSAIDERLRRQFLATVPMHVVTTDEYLIARHETTFEDYIEFLNALPPQERAARIPNDTDAGLTGAIKLSEEHGKWYLTLRRMKTQYTVRAGELIEYQGRTQRSKQNWLRFPVSGISTNDAEAYAEWLDRTRVPGARLCNEQEWERAARGADDRELPNGDRLDPDDANFDKTYAKVTSAMWPDEVGSHPGSRSPFGLDDMAGNIMEWTGSSLEIDKRVLRGGSFYYSEISNQSTNREVPEQEIRDVNFGFRICASLKKR